MPELRSADGVHFSGSGGVMSADGRHSVENVMPADGRDASGSTRLADGRDVSGNEEEKRTLYYACMEAAQYLAAHGIADAAVDAWYLLEYVTGVSRAKYLADRDKRLSREQWDAYAALIEKRGAHIPLQHLTGEQEFMGLPFRVNADVLIPRQDTELLAETALTILKTEISTKMTQKTGILAGGMVQKTEIPAKAVLGMETLVETPQSLPYRVLDLCTGSGCIATSIAKLFKQWWSRTCDGKIPLEIYASDISEAALAVARDNAGRLGAEVHFIQSDLFEGIAWGFGFDMIVSNPPYICTAVIEELDEEVRQHEPHLALDGGEDGLVLYRRIIRESVGWLNLGGWLLSEIGYDQGETVPEMMRQHGFSGVRVTKDLAGLDRVVSGQWRAQKNAANGCTMEGV